MITALFIATIAFCDSFAETALTVPVKLEPADCATEVFTIGTTFWKPVTCFGSASTVYFEPFPSGGSVENTSAASTLPESSAAYAEMPSGTNVTFFRPYCFVYPRKQVFRVLHSGKPPSLKLGTF